MIAKSLSKLIPLILLTLSLTSCALVPGSSMQVPDDDYDFFSRGDSVWFPGFGRDDSMADAPPIDELVNIHRITPELIRDETITLARPAATPISPELQEAITAYDYAIGVGDTLFITVYEHPELTAPAGNQNQGNLVGNRVRADGTIYYPYAGPVPVAGRTVEEVRQELTERLAEFITQPQIDLRVLQFRSQRFFVTGQVNDPGPKPITDIPFTVLDAINQAGGLAEGANWHDALLLREDGEEVTISIYEMLNNGRLDQNRLLRHGDVLHIPDIGNQKVFMMGELGNVSSLPMGNLSMSLTDALSQSGGIDQVAANASGVFVIRQPQEDSDKLADVYQLDARDALAFAMGARFMLRPEDVVFVTTAPVTRWNRVLSQIVPSLSSLILVERLGQ